MSPASPVPLELIYQLQITQPQCVISVNLSCSDFKHDFFAFYELTGLYGPPPFCTATIRCRPGRRPKKRGVSRGCGRCGHRMASIAIESWNPWLQRRPAGAPVGFGLNCTNTIQSSTIPDCTVQQGVQKSCTVQSKSWIVPYIPELYSFGATVYRLINWTTLLNQVIRMACQRLYLSVSISYLHIGIRIGVRIGIRIGVRKFLRSMQQQILPSSSHGQPSGESLTHFERRSMPINLLDDNV